eukprot:PhF_6_TR20993/c0_g1_i1/m.30120/K15537/AGMO; alkylglycerol monooxygenase
MKLSSPAYDPVHVPAWIQNSMMFCVIASWFGTYYIGKQYYTVEGITNYTAAMVPFFFLLITVEALHVYVGRVKSVGAALQPADAWSSLVAGSVQQALAKVCKRLLPTIPYKYIHDNYAVYKMDPDSWISLIIILVLMDFMYYWAHRWGHEIAMLWAGHSVHHSSEHFNLTTALRQSTWQHVYSENFYFPLAFFFPTNLFVLAGQMNLLFQFWVHTCVIRRMGFLEYIFVTPSHHRVHHDRRVHKNFSGMFICWDMIFGTFLDELAHKQQSPEVEETCYFGIWKPLRTWTECITQTALWEPVLATGRFLRGPGYYVTTSLRIIPPHAKGVSRLRFRCELGAAGKAFLLMQFLGGIYLILPIMDSAHLFSTRPLVCRALIGLYVFYSTGLMLDGNALLFYTLEIVRSIAVGLVYANAVNVEQYGLNQNHLEGILAWHGLSVLLVLGLNKKLLGKCSTQA